MRYLLFSMLILVGCTRKPSQDEVQQEAYKMSIRRDRCEFVAKSLKATDPKLEMENGEYLCTFVVKRNDKNFPPRAWLSLDEIRAIERYLAIKERQDSFVEEE